MDARSETDPSTYPKAKRSHRGRASALCASARLPSWAVEVLTNIQQLPPSLQKSAADHLQTIREKVMQGLALKREMEAGKDQHVHNRNQSRSSSDTFSGQHKRPFREIEQDVWIEQRTCGIYLNCH